MTAPNYCAGPLIWHEYQVDGDGRERQHYSGAVLHCASCGWINVTCNPMDIRHRETPLLREGLVA